MTDTNQLAGLLRDAATTISNALGEYSFKQVEMLDAAADELEKAEPVAGPWWVEHSDYYSDGPWWFRITDGTAILELVEPDDKSPADQIAYCESVCKKLNTPPAPQVPDATLRVIEAARCIQHWHDRGDGMIVSGDAVRALWVALGEYDAAAPKAPGHSESATPQPGES